MDRDLLDRTFDHAFAQPESLGTTNAMVIVHGSAIVRERCADGLDATTTHVSWSMAKSMLHAAIGILVREGRIDVAATADDPAWREAGDPRESITIDQLLKMRSGLFFHEDCVDARTSHVIEMLFGMGKPDAATYGAHWWLVPGSLGTFRCSGYNGQRIIVVPPLDLMVVRLGVSPIELERFSMQVIDAFRPLLDPP